MADLVRGRYHVTNPLLALTGGASNVIQPNLTLRSNFEFGIGGSPADTAAALTTAVMTIVPIPVEVGDVFSKITVLVGATAASVPVNQWAALYSGATVLSSAVLLGQSTDGVSTAIAASGALTFTLSSAVAVDGFQGNGYIFAAIMVKATTVPSLTTVPTPTAVNYRWFANGPQFLSATAGTALTATAPATAGSPSAQSTAPVVFLS